MKNLYLLSFILLFNLANSQTNILVTNPVVEEIMLGNYNPADYASSTPITDHEQIINLINEEVSTENLKDYLFSLSSFETRHTSSDTVSTTFGIGASRRWAISKYEEFSAENEGRLIPFYLQFDQDICGVGQHRNACAMLPGSDANDPSVIIIEAHMDSRCHDGCDFECTAHGMEDNGSGTALVIELARVMSQFTFEHSIVFMCTIGEEQGLYGANAFATFCQNKGIEVKAVFNNDIVGGIICGETSSAPSCPGLNHVDSTQVRLFSASGLSKQLSRFNKLEYQEELVDIVDVPMLLTIMSGEDRVGRGGDHIPFRQKGFPAMRFTSANEHGNANVNDPDYHDRQHTTDDILGVDTDGDNIIDSFFVNLNYLARNAVINGTSSALAAIGPETPEFEAGKFDDSLKVDIIDPFDYNHYRVFVRTNMQDFDTIYTVMGSKTINIERNPPSGSLFFVSVASVDANGIESLFTEEEFFFPTITSTGEIIEEPRPEKQQIAQLFQNRPNPFDEATIISFLLNEEINYKEAYIGVYDLNGKEIKRLPIQPKQGLNEVLYSHGYNTIGTYVYSLIIDGQLIDSKRMIFAN